MRRNHLTTRVPTFALLLVFLGSACNSETAPTLPLGRYLITGYLLNLRGATLEVTRLDDRDPPVGGCTAAMDETPLEPSDITDDVAIFLGGIDSLSPHILWVNLNNNIASSQFSPPPELGSLTVTSAPSFSPGHTLILQWQYAGPTPTEFVLDGTPPLSTTIRPDRRFATISTATTTRWAQYEQVFVHIHAFQTAPFSGDFVAAGSGMHVVLADITFALSRRQ
jgi:hypothetical protein